MTKKILILSSSPESYSTKRIVEEIEKKNAQNSNLDIEAEVVAPADFYAFISSANGHDRIYKRGETEAERLKIKDYIAVISRIAGTNFDYAALVVRHLNRNLGIFCTASETGLKLCSNKFLNAQFLSQYRFRVPEQILSHQPSDYSELTNKLGGLPLISKLQRGSQGDGVMILNDTLAASTSLRSFEKLGADVVLQKFINSGKIANDLRIFVIGAETENPKVFAYKRYSVAEDFRSNYSISGMGEKAKITDEEKEMAIESSRLMGLGICGVDIMRDVDDNEKPYIIETNGSPGLSGVEKITGENVAGAIVDYVLENYKKGNIYNYSMPDDTEIRVMRYLAKAALRYIKDANLYNKRHLYEKNYKAQDLLSSLIRKIEKLTENEK